MVNYLKRLRANQPEIRSSHWVLFFSLLGFGLRLQELSFQPLWGDEGWSFYLAAQPLPDLLTLTAVDIHPPLYYVLLKGWLAIIGTGAEEARFLSVVIGTALIPVLASLGQRLFDRQVQVMAAAVVAVMPLAIYYAQEVRMYGLVTLLGAMAVYFLLRAEEASSSQTGLVGAKLTKRNTWWYSLYVVTVTAALYTHYYAVFIPLFQLLYVLLIRHLLDRWLPRVTLSTLTPFILAGFLYLPWLVYAGSHLVSYIDNKRTVEGYTALSFIHFFDDHIVAFSVGHIPAVLREYAWIALPFALIALLGLITAAFRRDRVKHHPYLYLGLYLFLPLLAGYVINLVYPFTPRYYERTLLLAAPAYWLLIAVGLVWLWHRHLLWLGMVGPVLVLITSLSLTGFYTLPRYPDQDYRPLLEEIAARATPQDTVLASYQWQLGFYQAYLPPPRPYLFTVPGWGRDWADETGRAQLSQDLDDIFARSPRLWFPAHQAQGHLWEDQAEVEIAKTGYPALLEWHGPQTKLTLAASSEASLVQAPTANFENRLFLQKASVGNERYEAGRGIVPVELSWQKLAYLESAHRVSLRLADESGRTWASRDSHPRAGQMPFFELAIGDNLLDRHGLLIPAGTPPGRYRLLLSVRRVSDAHPLDLVDSEGQPLGAELLLGQIQVIPPDPPVGPEALPVEVARDAIFGQQVRLIGYSLGSGPFKAGQVLPINLFWESLDDSPGPLTVEIQLQDETGQFIVQHQQAPIWPSVNWQTGTLLRDPHDLSLPPTLPPGEYDLLLGLAIPEQTRLRVDGDDQLRLSSVTTTDRPRNFEAPDPQIALSANFADQAKLVGLDLPRRELRAGEDLPLTLYWQATATFEKSWTVFVHLLNNKGQIISQQDQIPGGGQFPTTSWLPDEYLIDTYNLTIPTDTLPGDKAYWLEIGLYDANDFSRLPVIEAGEVTDNHITLERWPISIE